MRIENILASRKFDKPKQWNYEYPQELVPEHAEYFEMDYYDRIWCDFYAKVASKTSLDYGEPRTKNQKWLDNFYGLLGEKRIKDILRNDLKVLHTYNEREPNFFEKTGKEPFDFAISTKKGKYFALEIKTTKERSNQKCMIIRKGYWKKCDYTIGIKMLSFTMDLENRIKIYGFVAGYLTKQEISNLRVRKNEWPCFDYPGRAIELVNVPHRISKLWQKIDSEGIHPVLEP